MTAASSPAEPPESTLAAVLAEHWEIDVDNGGDQTEFYCDGCKATLVVGVGPDVDAAHRLHVAAAILTATPTAAHVEADGLPAHQDYDEPCTHGAAYAAVQTHTRTAMEQGPDFCEECSTAVSEWVQWPCPRADPAAHVAELKAALAAAEARLRAVEAMAAWWTCDCDPGPDGWPHRGGCRSLWGDQLRAALSGLPQPTP